MKNLVVVTVLFSLLLSAGSCEGNNSNQTHNQTQEVSSESMCDNGVCLITQSKFHRLQEYIGSNRIIVLQAETFLIDGDFGFVNINLVSDLTITGSGSSSNGTVIHCSQEGSFGFRVGKHATEIIVTGIKFENCVSKAVYTLPVLSDPVVLWTTILVEGSIHVSLSQLYIENSPGFSVVVDDSLYDAEKTNLVMNNCTICNSQHGSLRLHRTRNLLMDIIIRNSSMGFVSEEALIEIKDIVVTHCGDSSLENGKLIVSGSLTMNNSPLHIIGQSVLFQSSQVTFNGGTEETERIHKGLTVKGNSSISLEGNSSVLFTKYNLTKPSTALLLVGSTLVMGGESSLVFTNNTARNGSSTFLAIKGIVFMMDEATLLVNNNLAIAGWTIFMSFRSVFLAQHESFIHFSYNKAFDYGRVAEFNDTLFGFVNNTHVSLNKNLVTNGSFVARFHGDTFSLDNTTVSVVGNSAYINCTVLVLSGRIALEGSIAVVNNTATENSRIVILKHQLMSDLPLSLFYNSLFQEHRKELERLEDYIEWLHYQLNETNSTESYDIYIQNVIPNVRATLGIEIPPGSIISSSNPIALRTSIFVYKGDLIFHGNKLTEQSVGLLCSDYGIYISEGNIVLEENECETSSYLMLLNNVVLLSSTFHITHNKVHKDSSILLSVRVILGVLDSQLLLTDNSVENGFSLLFFSTIIVMSGPVKISNNNISDFGALNLISSTAIFLSTLEVKGNRAESGGINADHSDIYFMRNTTFSDNQAANGGGISLISSVLHVSPNATVVFSRNSAERLGGAIFISQPRTTYVCDFLTATASSCSIQVIAEVSSNTCGLFSLAFTENRAGIAGNAIYGGKTSACVPSNNGDFCSTCPFPDISDLFQYNGVNDSSDLSNFTSDPTRVCLCYNGIPDCYKVLTKIAVHPGENFNLSLAVVGYGLGTVAGSVIARSNNMTRRVSGESLFGSELQYSQQVGGVECQNVEYSIVSERYREYISLAVDTNSFGRSFKEVQEVVHFQTTRNISSLLRSPHNSVYENFFHIPVFLDITLLPCPVGLQLVSGRCVCHQTLLKEGIESCSISSGAALIKRPAPYWIGLPNDTNSSLLFHPHCPFDYCQSEDVEITVVSPNTQCRNSRSGILCGSCSDGLSMILGSSACKTCSNVFLVSIIIFILVGIALVAVIKILDMTVSVGTLNGIILFANILQANRLSFLPQSASHARTLVAILSVFISWLNLDIGIPICFFDGLTTYIKTWLQFAFPLYIMGMVLTVIIASKYSSRVTQLFGTNTVSVLATLVLLSYTKVLRILITAFSFTIIRGSEGHYYSVVWLADGNLQYFETRHTILFVVALLVLLVLGIPYTLLVTAAPWIQRSKWNWVSSFYNKFKPLFDAYMGPYKDNCRYWTGMLLLSRVLIVVFSSISNTNTVAGPQLNLLLLTLSSSALLALTTALRPYKNRLLNGLEIFHLAILLIFSSSNLYVSSFVTTTEVRAGIYVVLVGTCFLVFLGVCVGHIWYTIRRVKLQMQQAPQEREMEEHGRQWYRAKVGNQEEDMEGVAISTGGTTNSTSDGSRRDSIFRESVLELGTD